MGDGLSCVLVTGASGFLGRAAVARCAAAGIAVVKTSLSGRDGVACDLMDVQAFDALLKSVRPTAIIHCAAQVPKSSEGYSDEAAAAASVAMVRTLSIAQCPIVFASSMTVYEHERPLPTAEEDAHMPRSAYARGKWCAEQIVFERNRDGDVALRFPGLFGFPRRSGLIYNAIRSFLASGSFEFKATPVLWAAMHVDDAAEYAVRAAVASRRHPVAAVNVGYEDAFSIPTALQRIAELCGCNWSAVHERFPVFAANLVRLRERFGSLEATFDQRVREMIAALRNEAQLGMGSNLA